MDDYSRYTCKDAAALEHDRKQAELQKKEVRLYHAGLKTFEACTH